MCVSIELNRPPIFDTCQINVKAMLIFEKNKTKELLELCAIVDRRKRTSLVIAKNHKDADDAI